MPTANTAFAVADCASCRTTKGLPNDTMETTTPHDEKEESDMISLEPIATSVYTMSAGRMGALAGGLLGLAGLIAGGLALVRPHSRIGVASGRLGATIALVAGLIGIGLGALVAATSDSGIGTGNGRGGAYVALVVGTISLVLGGVALTRSRRMAS